MKKALLILTVLTAFLASCVPAQAQVSWPFGQGDTATVAYADTIELTADNAWNYVFVDTLTDTPVVNVTTLSDLRVGGFLFLDLLSDGTGRSTTPGTGFLSNAIAGTANKRNIAVFIWNGLYWVHIGTQQVN